MANKNRGFKVFKKGLATGLFLQLAVGPVFFFIINLTLQNSIYNGLIAVLAVTIVDYFYITVAIFGLGKVLEKKKIKNIFGMISSMVLIVFGILLIKGITNFEVSNETDITSNGLLSSFVSVFILTISSPMTIIFFTSIFTAKAVENNFSKKDLYIFGFSVGAATFLFLGFSVLLFSFLKESVPVTLIQFLNILVGIVLIGYGILRMIKILKPKN